MHTSLKRFMPTKSSLRPQVGAVLLTLLACGAIASGVVHLAGWHHLDSRLSEILVGIAGVGAGSLLLRIGVRTWRAA
jgi:hypothetical protein